jgi:flagellin-like hook-associated protein FlgL
MINTDYLLNNTEFNLIALNPIYQLDNINPIEADFYSELSSINIPTDTFINPILDSQYNILNLNNTIGFMQTAYQTLDQITPYAQELLTLSSALQNSTDPSIIQKDMEDIYNQINDYIQNTTYNGVTVFNQDIQIGDSTLKLELPSIDITDQDSIENFIKQIDTLKNDIKSYLDTSSLYSDNFVNSLFTEIYPNNHLDFLNTVNTENLKITADLLAVAHNQDYLSQNIEQLLL